MPPVSAFFIPASALVSRPEHGIEAAVAFSHQRPTTRSEPSALARDTGGTGSLRKKPELRASIIVINQVKTTHLWALYMP